MYGAEVPHRSDNVQRWGKSYSISSESYNGAQRLDATATTGLVHTDHLAAATEPRHLGNSTLADQINVHDLSTLGVAEMHTLKLIGRSVSVHTSSTHSSSA